MHTWNVDIFIKEPVKLESHPKHYTQLFLNTVRIYLKGKHKKIYFFSLKQHKKIMSYHYISILTWPGIYECTVIWRLWHSVSVVMDLHAN